MKFNRERLWKDVESACVEIARIDFQNTEREPQQQEPVQSENQRKREKMAQQASSQSLMKKWKMGITLLPVEAIVAEEIRKIQLDNGLKLEAHYF